MDPPPSALRETAESVASHLAAGGGAVAERGGELAGSVLWVVRDGGLYLHRLAVHPDHQRHGVGWALVQAVEEEALRQGQPRLHLGVRLALAGNRRLFARCGFTETVLHSHDGHAEPTWVEAEKSLSRLREREGAKREGEGVHASGDLAGVSTLTPPSVRFAAQPRRRERED